MKKLVTVYDFQEGVMCYVRTRGCIKCGEKHFPRTQTGVYSKALVCNDQPYFITIFIAQIKM